MHHHQYFELGFQTFSEIPSQQSVQFSDLPKRGYSLHSQILQPILRLNLLILFESVRALTDAVNRVIS